MISARSCTYLHVFITQFWDAKQIAGLDAGTGPKFTYSPPTSGARRVSYTPSYFPVFVLKSAA